VATSVPDPTVCYLAQGYICLGPATRSGCGERCINANMTCRGCFGPTPEAIDLGAKALSAIASLVDTKDGAEAARIAAMVPDPAGVLYMYALPSSLLQRKKMEAAHV
jgi:F420-non-reducing hydrogenase small subunit